jgi:hypothetical protein
VTGTHQGRYTINMNYARQGDGIEPGAHQYNLSNNYGVQAGNRTHIFNAAYSIELSNPARDKILAACQRLATIRHYAVQSGPNLTGIQGQNFGMNLNSYKIPGTTFNVSNVAPGTPNIQLNPVLTRKPSPGSRRTSTSTRAAPDRNRAERPQRSAGPTDLRSSTRPGPPCKLHVQGIEEAATRHGTT